MSFVVFFNQAMTPEATTPRIMPARMNRSPFRPKARRHKDQNRQISTAVISRSSVTFSRYLSNENASRFGLDSGKNKPQNGNPPRITALRSTRRFIPPARPESGDYHS